MKPTWALALALFTVSPAPPPAAAGGFLWLGAEFQGEGNIYRYNIDSGVVDLVTPNSLNGGEHWNKMVTDGVDLYLGNPNLGAVAVADIYTGIVSSTASYSTALTGRLEGGAYHADSGNIWRVSFDGTLHEVEPDGTWVQTFAVPAGLVGVEWVADTMYVSNWTTGEFGTIAIAGASATYQQIPWASGGSPGANPAGLAFDPIDGVLYLIAQNSILFTVQIVGSEAVATEVVELDTVGYPVGGLVDGMGWVAPQATSADLPAPRSLGYRLGAPYPNPASRATHFFVDSERAGDYRLDIIDMQGRRVRVLASGRLAEGERAFTWDLRDESGRDVPAGVYFVRLMGDQGNVAKRVVRIR